MFGLYNKNDNEMFVMTEEKIWNYLQNNCAVFQNYSVYTDGNTVIVSETSAGANGKLSEQTVEEFFYGFEEEGLLIRPIKE